MPRILRYRFSTVNGIFPAPHPQFLAISCHICLHEGRTLKSFGGIRMIASLLILCVAAYLLGAVPFGYIFGRMKGMDVRNTGSGNIGATNVARSLGWGWGAVVFFCDALKGFLSAWVLPLFAERFSGQQAGDMLPLACALMAVAGHNWPVFLRFRGGKGIATSLGALLGIAPASATLGVASWAAVFGLTRYVSVASMSGAIIVAISAWAFYGGSGPLVPSVLSVLAVLALLRHKANIGRLLRGSEPRFGCRPRPDRMPETRAGD